MADHIREQIMDAIVTDLTGLTTTGTNVHRLRAYPQTRNLLPSINIVQETDELINQDTGQVAWGFYDHRLVVRIEARVSDATNTDQTLNQIEKEVVIALAAGTVTAIDGVQRIWMLSTSEPEVNPEGEQKLAYFEIRWGVQYRTLCTDPSLA